MVQRIRLTDTRPQDYLYEESIKKLRANIQFSSRRNKTILFTSTFEGEGKSDVVFHTAVEMGKMGRRVLLIDADIRNSQAVSRYHIQGRTLGLSEYLSGQVDDLHSVIYATNYENLFVILAGAYASNPSEMLGDDVVGKLLEWARGQFDYVFVDTPPLGTVIDAAMIGHFCDAGIIVIESGAVSYHAALKVKQQLELSGTRVLGVVLNKVDPKDVSVYDKYGKYGKYGSYGYGGEGRRDSGESV